MNYWIQPSGNLHLGMPENQAGDLRDNDTDRNNHIAALWTFCTPLDVGCRQEIISASSIDVQVVADSSLFSMTFTRGGIRVKLI